MLRVHSAKETYRVIWIYSFRAKCHLYKSSECVTYTFPVDLPATRINENIERVKEKYSSVTNTNTNIKKKKGEHMKYSNIFTWRFVQYLKFGIIFIVYSMYFHNSWFVVKVTYVNELESLI